MATTKTQEKKKGGSGEKRSSMLPKDHKGAGLPVPPPRLHGHYVKVVRARLAQQFGLKNPHEIPTIEKITVNVGMGEAIKQPKVLDAIVDELATITGQKPLRTRAKKSIANYGQREGQEIGVAVTLGVPRPVHLDGDPPHPRLPRAQHPQLRRPRQLQSRREGTDDLPRDQLRPRGTDPRHGPDVRDHHQPR
jgi:hypothetical protein